MFTWYRVCNRHQHSAISKEPCDVASMTPSDPSLTTPPAMLLTQPFREQRPFPPHVSVATGAATSLNFPAEHAVQVLAPVPLKYVPAAQLAHASAAAAPMAVENLPLTHHTHASAVLAPVAARYVPAPQPVHADTPSVALYLPAPQDAHVLSVVAPVAVENFPAPHNMHPVFAMPEMYVPTPQPTQVLATEAPEVVENFPFSHGRQVVDKIAPTFVEYVPQEQRRQGSSLLFQYVPAAHSVQVVAPVVIRENDPSVHAMQSMAPSFAE